MNAKEEDANLIKAWKKAGKDLGLEIISPFILNTTNGKVDYPILVKSFGGKHGTIIARHELFFDFPMPKHKDYFISAVNAEYYSDYNRTNFIETLEDWGFFGNSNDVPKWFNGIVYEQ